MTCKYCGFQISENANVCPNCGSYVSDYGITQPIEQPAEQYERQQEQYQWQDSNAWQNSNSQDANAWQQNNYYYQPSAVNGGNSFFEDGAWFAAAASLASWLICSCFDWIQTLLTRHINYFSFGYGFISAVFALLYFVFPIGICVGLFFAAFSKKYSKSIIAELPLAFIPFVCYRGATSLGLMCTNFLNGIIHNTAGNVICIIIRIFIQIAVAAGAFFLTKLILSKKDENKNYNEQSSSVTQ